MQTYSKKQLAKIVELMTQGMTEAGFTGVKVDRADIPQASFDTLTQEDTEDDRPTAADLSSEVVYHRVKTDQGDFGFWLQPYPTLDLTGAAVDIAAFFPPGQDLSGMPPDWCYVGMGEDVFRQLFAEFAKKSGQP